jgi:DNA-directed RNA polymerase specialized sigma54-like protein
MSAGLHLSQRLSQQMILSPQLQQSLALLQAPVLELKAMVEQEMQQNPVLEDTAEIETDPEMREAKAEGEAAAADPAEPPPDLQFDPATEKAPEGPVDKFDEDMQKLLKLDEEWREVFSQTNSVNRATEEDEERRQHMFDSLTTVASLQEQLLEQIRFSNVAPEKVPVAEMLIGNIDDRGYLTAKPEELTFSTGIAVEEILDALKILQSFEPAGVGARDLRECLMLQLERQGRTESVEYQILRDHMEALGKRRFPEIARHLDITPAEAQDAAARIAQLEPRPGRAFASEAEQFVVPELIVTRVKVTDDNPDVLASDIDDPFSLAESLAEPDEPIIDHVRQRISINTRRELQLWRNSGSRQVPQTMLESIAADLTKVVRGDLLFDAQLLAETGLSTPARRALEGFLAARANGHGEHPVPHGKIPGDTSHANRVLLNDIFPLLEKRERWDFTVANRNDHLPNLRISNTYKDLLSQAETSPEVRDYIREKIKAGKFLIKSLHQRQSTILNIGNQIVKRQREFMEKGVEHLKPMTMVQIAEVVGVHETTVSRAVSGKFMQTPQGIFEMKFFFTSGVSTSDGQTMSNTSVKTILAEMIAGEDKGKPLSDEELVARLKDKGIVIARRTVAKYRSELNVLPSHLRRSY